ncbi:MAG: hypothetical protein F6K41_29410 [Symploca sp. SIO3E6]|nr:hypothetical protein [Caldora sp. SIO3E6]
MNSSRSMMELCNLSILWVADYRSVQFPIPNSQFPIPNDFFNFPQISV